MMAHACGDLRSQDTASCAKCDSSLSRFRCHSTVLYTSMPCNIDISLQALITQGMIQVVKLIKSIQRQVQQLALPLQMPERSAVHLHALQISR